jgi:hypothetical protein
MAQLARNSRLQGGGRFRNVHLTASLALQALIPDGGFTFVIAGQPDSLHDAQALLIILFIGNWNKIRIKIHARVSV